MTELALGTANWGASYGAPGREVRVEEPAAAAMAQLFLSRGHRLVDTAPAYGEAEELVGRVFAGSARVVTKLSGSASADDVDHVRASVAESCRRLRVDRLEGVLLHEPASAVEAPQKARRVVDAVRATRLVDRVGVSVYTPEEAWAAVEELDADLLQVPCNLLDQSFLASGHLRELAARGVDVHVRSVFLNGVLLAEPQSLTGPLEPLAEGVRRVRAVANELNLPVLRLALGFARDVLQPAAVVCGAVEPGQLAALLDAWAAPELDGVDWPALAADGCPAVDPRTWR